MFNRKKKEINYTVTGLSVVIGALFGFVYALLSAKKTGKEFQKDIRRMTDKAIKDSKSRITKELARAKKEFGNEFESHLIKSVANIKDKSKNLFGKVKALVN